ncbi:MAG: hypothetical protein AB1384_04265 [Actinomycetota bacterium]
MKAMRILVGLAAAVMAAAAIMYIVSFWTGEILGGPVYTARLVLILLLLAVLALLLPRLSRGTLPWRLWMWVTVAMIINVIPVTLETINAYAGRNVFSPDLIFLFYLFVFIPVLVIIGLMYYGFKKQGFEFSRESLLSVLPSMLIILVVTIVVLIVPMARSGGDLGVKVSDIFALVVQISALCIISFMAITIGKGDAGRPYLYISLALACVIVQTILTAHIRLVGIMSTTELADIFLQIAYLLLIFAAYFQYEIVAPVAIEG